MKHVRFLLLVAVVFLMAPAAFAFEPDRDLAPSDPCGSIDPDRPCYLTSGTRDCPAATSLASCNARCNCEFENNKKRCKSSPTCINLAASERDACYGHCTADWS